MEGDETETISVVVRKFATSCFGLLSTKWSNCVERKFKTPSKETL